MGRMLSKSRVKSKMQMDQQLGISQDVSSSLFSNQTRADKIGWDTQLIARAANARSAPLDVDTKINPAQKEYLQLWRNSEKVLAPFNLTPFAVTLVCSLSPHSS